MTDGAKALRRALEERPEQAQAISRALGVSSQAIWTWKTGNRRPDAHLREGLRVMLGIAPDDWMTAEERRAVQRAERAVAGKGR